MQALLVGEADVSITSSCETLVRLWCVNGALIGGGRTYSVEGMSLHVAF